MHTIDCSSIGRYQVSSSFYVKRFDDIEELIPCGAQDSQKARGLSQEAFSDVSSRTYLSSLERGLKSPTLSKVAELCEVMDVHPLTLLTLAYGGDSKGVSEVIERVQRELAAIQARQGK